MICHSSCGFYHVQYFHTECYAGSLAHVCSLTSFTSLHAAGKQAAAALYLDVNIAIARVEDSIGSLAYICPLSGGHGHNDLTSGTNHRMNLLWTPLSVLLRFAALGALS